MKNPLKVKTVKELVSLRSKIHYFQKGNNEGEKEKAKTEN